MKTYAIIMFLPPTFTVSKGEYYPIHKILAEVANVHAKRKNMGKNVSIKRILNKSKDVDGPNGMHFLEEKDHIGWLFMSEFDWNQYLYEHFQKHHRKKATAMSNLIQEFESDDDALLWYETIKDSINSGDIDDYLNDE
jgi:hypothetical protein